MLQTDERSLQVIFSAALAALISYLGVVAIPVTVLMTAMIIDYVTGMAAAWHNKKLSSKKGLSGIIKKISYEHSVFFGVLVTVWLIINELISILENLKAIGVPLPEFLVKIVRHLKNKCERKDDKDE